MLMDVLKSEIVHAIPTSQAYRTLKRSRDVQTAIINTIVMKFGVWNFKDNIWSTKFFMKSDQITKLLGRKQWIERVFRNTRCKWIGNGHHCDVCINMNITPGTNAAKLPSENQQSFRALTMAQQHLAISTSGSGCYDGHTNLFGLAMVPQHCGTSTAGSDSCDGQTKLKYQNSVWLYPLW